MAINTVRQEARYNYFNVGSRYIGLTASVISATPRQSGIMRNLRRTQISG